MHVHIYVRRHACKNVRVYPFILVQIYMASFPRRIEFSSNSLWENQIPHRRETDLKTRELQCSAYFWALEDSNGRLGLSHYCRDSVLFGLASSLGLRKYSWPCHTEANELPPLATIPHPVQMSASSAAPSGQKTKQWTVPTTRSIHLLLPSMSLSLCVKLNERLWS